MMKAFQITLCLAFFGAICGMYDGLVMATGEDIFGTTESPDVDQLSFVSEEEIDDMATSGDSGVIDYVITLSKMAVMAIMILFRVLKGILLTGAVLLDIFPKVTVPGSSINLLAGPVGIFQIYVWYMYISAFMYIKGGKDLHYGL